MGTNMQQMAKVLINMNIESEVQNAEFTENKLNSIFQFFSCRTLNQTVLTRKNISVLRVFRFQSRRNFFALKQYHI